MELRLRRIFDCFVVTFICAAAFLLLPLLLLSLRARQWFFVRIMAVAGRLWRHFFEDTRRKAIAALDELESSDSELRADGAIRVLEIGAGSGANFGFIRRKVKYWNVDPNTEFQNFLLETMKKYPKQVEMERWVVCYGEDMRDVPDAHFDAVIVTHLLCSVHRPDKVLQECRRVLVQGGRMVFMEHVAQPEGSAGRMLQNVLTPLWSIICCGCCLNRDSGELIKNAGFSEVHLKETNVDMPIVLTRHVYGYAVA